jgi:hypothetical protein
MSIVKIMHGETELLQVVAALHPPCRLTGSLNRWKQKRDQHANDGNHDQKFHECKPSQRRVSNFSSKHGYLLFSKRLKVRKIKGKQRGLRRGLRFLNGDVKNHWFRTLGDYQPEVGSVRTGQFLPNQGDRRQIGSTPLQRLVLGVFGGICDPDRVGFSRRNFVAGIHLEK